MNIFHVDRSPVVAAQALCDVHVVKMVVESAQLLSTAQHTFGLAAPYKPTHRKHPCALWVQEGVENYLWLLDHLKALCVEYTARYKRKHSTERHLWDLMHVPTDIPIRWTSPPQAMPDQFKHHDPVQAYRAYYRHKAKTLPRFSYKGRQPPAWLSEVPDATR
jgi:hypothetical protein